MMEDLRSLALKDRRFQTWAEVEQAIADATVYWNAHRHPYVWGRRRRHRRHPKRHMNSPDASLSKNR